MQTFDAIRQRAGQVSSDGFVNDCNNDCNVGGDRLDAGLGQALVCAHPYTARQEHLAVGDRGCHAALGILGGRIETVGLPLNMDVPASAPAVGHLLALFMVHDLPLFNRQNNMVGGAAEVLADSDAVLLND